MPNFDFTVPLNRVVVYNIPTLKWKCSKNDVCLKYIVKLMAMYMARPI